MDYHKTVNGGIEMTVRTLPHRQAGVSHMPYCRPILCCLDEEGTVYVELAADRIMPALSTPRSLRGGRLAI